MFKEPTKKELADKLSKVVDKSATAILRDYNIDEIKEELHKRGLMNKRVKLGTPVSGASGHSKKGGYKVRTQKKRSRSVSRRRSRSRRSSSSRRVSRRRSRSRRSSSSRRVSRRRSRSRRVPCKSYQKRNANGRCVNKECGPGKIRDSVTHKCRIKKNTSRRKSRRRSRSRASSRSKSRRRSRSPRRKSRRRSGGKSRVPCKSYQERNANGRCVNKECGPGQVRDVKTKMCRPKKK